MKCILFWFPFQLFNDFPDRNKPIQKKTVKAKQYLLYILKIGFSSFTKQRGFPTKFKNKLKNHGAV
jgi:hypothetical protein